MIGLGIIGCGGHAQHHAEHIGHEFQIVTVWDPDPEAAASIRSFEKSATLEQLLESPLIDAVMICSPDENHLDQIEKALAAGKHVFCEKPLIVPGQDLARLEAAFDLAKQKQLVLTSCHPRRYDRPIWWLRDRVYPYRDLDGFPERFGKVVSFSFDFSYHKPESEWKAARSLLLDHASHEFDLMNCLFGINPCVAWKRADSFDHYDVVGTRDDGIHFNFQGTRRLDVEKYHEWCRVRFERGEVILDMMMGVAYVLNHEGVIVETVPGLTTDHEGRLRKVARDFALQINNDSSGYLTRSEMLMNTEVGIVLQDPGFQRINVRTYRS